VIFDLVLFLVLDAIANNVISGVFFEVDNLFST